MIDVERGYNVTWEQAETFPRHAPVRNPDPRSIRCVFRDELGRLCGREYSYGKLFRTGRTTRRHVPARGTPHPR